MSSKKQLRTNVYNTNVNVLLYVYESLKYIVEQNCNRIYYIDNV